VREAELRVRGSRSSGARPAVQPDADGGGPDQGTAPEAGDGAGEDPAARAPPGPEEKKRGLLRALTEDRSAEIGRLAADPGYRGPRVACGQGHEAEFVSCRDKTFGTVPGPVTLSRAWYHCPACKHGFAPGDLVPGDDGARALVAAAYDGFIEVVTAALTRAQDAGEVITSAAPAAQAWMLLLLFQGSALVARANPDREGLAAGIDAALDALRPG
jgi:hypothetical protein